MEGVERPRIKICCISSIEEARLAIKYGADALGLVSAMPSGPGVISQDLIRDIVKEIPAGVSTFLLTSMQDAGSIIKQLVYCGVNTVQICDSLIEGTYDDIRNSVPGISVVQVVHVNGDDSLKEAEKVSENADTVLLDSGNQLLNIKELGGTGRTHDWNLSRKIREALKIPVYLAGGLTPGNIESAIMEVKPFGVDICSGVRTNGSLDERKLADFTEKIFKMY